MDIEPDPPQLLPLCPFCHFELNAEMNQVHTVKKKGLQTLINKSKTYGDSKWKEQKWENICELSCHMSCHKKYLVTSKPMVPVSTNVSTSSSSSANEPAPGQQLSLNPMTMEDFNFLTHCYYCGHLCNVKRKQPCSRVVQDKSLKNRVIDTANLLNNDYSTKVLQRVTEISCSVEEHARYHTKCATSFFSMNYAGPGPARSTTLMKECFEAICQYIEGSEKYEFRVPELNNVYKGYSMDNKTLFRKLEEKYGTDIFILSTRTKPTVIFYKFSFADVYQKHCCGEELNDVEENALFRVTTDVLKKKIKQHSDDTKNYPPASDFMKKMDDDIPFALREFLQLLLDEDLSPNVGKYDGVLNTLAHAVIKCVKGKYFMSTLHLAIGIYIQRKTGSKMVIDLLNRMGVCASYFNLMQFENSAVMHPPTMTIESETFVQHVFDNTDHNVRILDGKETFHCLGGIAIYTLESNVVFENSIQRVTKLDTEVSAAVAAKSRIPAIPYVEYNAVGFQEIKYVAVSGLKLPFLPFLPPHYAAYLWANAFMLPRIPSWAGFMETICDEDIPIQSRVICLPFINEPPSKPSTLNTALHFARAEATKLNQKYCFVTFDQPLYHKAREIVANAQKNGKLKDVIVRLGGFHLLMFYLGAVGYIMGGSGLESMWSVVYAPASVKQMLTGHAYARAMRAHILTFMALGIVFGKSIETARINEYKTVLSAKMRWDEETSDPLTFSTCRTDESIAAMTEDLIAHIQNLNNRGPTTQLRIQYFQMIAIALQFVEAERLGNWQLHLQAVKEMLPVLSAAGHLPYARSGQLYLQDMVQLDIEAVDDPGYELFSRKGYFTARRSDKIWAGVWADMTIEQTLNRYFGTDLKHGREVTPGVVARYLLAMPTVFTIMTGVEEYFNVTTESSEQHKDLGKKRMEKDQVHLQQFLYWLKKHNPLEERKNLVSLASGIVSSDIQCHMAFEEGQKLMAYMVGKSVKECKLSMSNRVKTLDSVTAHLHVGGNSYFPINSSHLMNRLTAIFKFTEVERKRAFEFEISPYPLALFDDKGFMRKTAKADLYPTFKTAEIPSRYRRGISDLFENSIFVIDGGFLLHQVTWPHSCKFNEIFERYRDYIIHHYNGHAYVVFDGYKNECIGVKSYERYRRREKNMAPNVEIAPDKLVTLSKPKFFSNTANKYKFVQLLARFLEESKIPVHIASEDADVLIVNTALKVYKDVIDHPVVIVGNDVDLLVLLIGLTNSSQSIYFNKIVPSTKTSALYSAMDHENLRPYILFAHAFVGCDITSALFSKGKKSILTLLAENKDIQNIVNEFYEPDNTAVAISNAAEKMIAHLYDFANENISLGEARYRKYESSTALDLLTRLSCLPPTKGALREHAKRVYLQVQTWLGNNLDPKDWGWMRSDTMFLPVMTEDNSAPEELLNMISCGCTTKCATKRCKCKKTTPTARRSAKIAMELIAKTANQLAQI